MKNNIHNSHITLLCILILAVSFLSYGCSKKDENNPIPPPDYSFVKDNPDPQGNVLINNYSGSNLVLYKGSSRLKNIPNDGSDYVVNIPVEPSGNDIELRIYKYDDVKEHISTPDSAKIYKKLFYPFSGNISTIPEVSWAITSEQSGIGQGKITAIYNGSTYKVKVHKGEISGPKLFSIAPGQSQRSIFSNYGDYKLFYSYYETEPQNPKPVVIGEEFTLNEQNNEKTLIIPQYQTTPVESGRIKIFNQTNLLVKVFSGPTLIEDIMIYSGNRTGLSSINPSGSREFTLPIGTYSFFVKEASTNNLVTEKIYVIAKDSYTEWVINNNEVIISSGPANLSTTINSNVTFTYSSPGTNKFEYKLENSYGLYPEEWTEHTGTSLTFNDLDDNQDNYYKLSLRAFGSTKEVTREFKVKALKYNTIWLENRRRIVRNYDPFEVHINLNEIDSTALANLVLSFDKNKLTLAEVRQVNDFWLNSTGNVPAMFVSNSMIDANSTGKIEINISLLNSSPSNATGSGRIATLRFRAKVLDGSLTTISFSDQTELRTANNYPLVLTEKINGKVNLEN